MNEDDARFYKIIGQKIRRLRKGKHMTLRDLAAKLNHTSKTIQRYEKGERRLDVVKLRNLIEALDYNYDDFMREVQYEQLTDTPSHPENNSHNTNKNNANKNNANKNDTNKNDTNKNNANKNKANIHEKDFEKILDATKQQILSQDEILLSEHPVSKEDIVSIFDAMSVALEIIKRKI